MLKNKRDSFSFEISPEELKGLIDYNESEFELRLIAVPAGHGCFSVFGQLTANGICLNSKVINFRGEATVDALQKNLQMFLRSGMFDFDKLVRKLRAK